MAYEKRDWGAGPPWGVNAMPVSDLPLFSILKPRMRWLEASQKMLANNMANADSSRFHAHDLKQLDFKAELDVATAQNSIRRAAAHPDHITDSLIDNTSFQQMAHSRFETNLSENAVVLKEKITQLAQMQMDHQTAASLYVRGLSMIKTAFGKR
jgi:flagellar basal-body rod protein FlgB